MSRRIVHVDMDAFFASVELLRYPMLKGQPVVVGGRRVDAPQRNAQGEYQFALLGHYTGRGVVTTATYEARALGVHSAMPLMKAAQLAPKAVLLPANFAAYRFYSQRFKEAVRQISPLIENIGVDEIYVDASHLHEDSEQLALMLQQQVHEATGLSCSIGIAPNKLLAKIASDFDKPGGRTILQAADVAHRIWPLPVGVINGIGPKAQEKLVALGITTVGALAHSSAALLQQHFGTNYARWLLQVAHGQDDRPIKTVRRPKSLSRERTFSRDLHVQNDRMLLSEVLWQLCQRLAADLVEEGFYAQQIEIKLRFDDFETVTRSTLTGQPTQEAEHLRHYARQCLRRVFLQQRRLRLLGIKAGRLLSANEYQQQGQFGMQLRLYDE